MISPEPPKPPGDLTQWLPLAFTEGSTDDGNGETEIVPITDSEPTTSHQERFLRVRVESLP